MILNLLRSVREWLESLTPVPPVAEFSPNTAESTDADGSDASNVTPSAIPKIQDAGYSDPTQGTTTMANDVLVRLTREALQEAAELHFQALYGAGVLIDWTIIGETVDADLDKESDSHALYVATSSNMTSWKLFGMTQSLAKFVYAGII